jgi:hypothetical protein
VIGMAGAAGVAVVYGLVQVVVGLEDVLVLIGLALFAVVEQASQFVARAPGYLRDAQNNNTVLGGLNERFHLQQQLEALVSGPGLGGGLLGAGRAVFSALTNVLILVVLTVTSSRTATCSSTWRSPSSPGCSR